MLAQDELVPLQEVLHGKVVEQKVLNEELEHSVGQLEGVGGADDDVLQDLVQQLAGRRGTEGVDGELSGGGVRESPVDGGDGGGYAEYQDEGQAVISLHQQDQVSQGWPSTGLEVLQDDH